MWEREKVSTQELSVPTQSERSHAEHGNEEESFCCLMGEDLIAFLINEAFRFLMRQCYTVLFIRNTVN